MSEAPKMPTGTIDLLAPPELPASEGGSMLMMMLPMLGSVGAIAMVTMMNRGPAGFLTGGMVLMSSLGFVAVNGWRQRAQRNAEVLRSRREFLTFIAETRQNVRVAASKQFRALLWRHPDPSVLVYMAEERSRVWERGKDSPEFLRLRVGLSDQKLAVGLEVPALPPLAQVDPVCATALHRFVATHELQPDLPLAVDVRSSARVRILSKHEEAGRSLLRSMAIGAATVHHPDDLVIAFVVRGDRLDQWDWVKWLPHAHSRRQRDRLGPVRMVTTSFAQLVDLLPEDLEHRGRFRDTSVQTPHVLVVVDGVPRPSGDSLFGDEGVDGLTVLENQSEWVAQDEPDTVQIFIPKNGTDPASLKERGKKKITFTHDRVGIPTAEETARRLLPLYKGSGAITAASGKAYQMGITELLGLPDVRDLDMGMAWRPRTGRDRLRVPIGQDDKGVPLVLDLKEAAQDGMGPHGVMIGATGSGKSEVLRTLVLALALTHSPEQLNFVLVDYKGGATFAGMADMPHVSAIITNLGRESGLVDRFEDALRGEITRRQEVLREAGNFANVTDYEEARRNGRTELVPLPALLVVLDEFSELLDARSEFIDSFINIGRVGRSLSVHLLFASQRLESSKLRGLDTYLSYRVGLRTFSSAESRTILDSDVAFHLPREPGGGYLLATGSNAMTRFRAAYVSGKLAARQVAATTSDTTAQDVPIVVEPFTIARTGVHEEPEPVLVDPAEMVMEEAPAGSEFEIAVAAMAGLGPAAHKIWLPPLETPEPLDRLFGDLAVDPRLGLTSARWRAAGALTVPVGLVDVPFEQRREPLVLNLAGAGGHVVVVGRPLSGKTTLLRTMVCALALTATPAEVQVYVLDFGGGAFTALRDLPHTAGVASRTETDVVRRTLAEVTSIIDAREHLFRTHGIDSMDTYRQRRARGEVDDGWGDVFLVIDGWGVMRQDFEQEELTVQTVVARGLTFGVHLIASVSRWMEMRPAVQDLVGTRLELRLGDPNDSAFKKTVGERVPLDVPGRGLHPVTGLHTMAALPRIDGCDDPQTLADGVEHLVTKVKAAWTGPAGPQLRLLPEHITLAQVRAQARPDDPRVLLGVDEAALAPFGIDPATEPHLFLFGEGGSGKSTMLRTYADEVRRLYTAPKRAKFFVVDYRRALLDQIPPEHLMSYSTSHEQATAHMAEVAAYFKTRLPGPDVTAEQLRNRSWWTGAEGFVLVDDYDLVATSQGNPLLPLVSLLPQAVDIGLHVVVTRHSGGASRAMYDTVLQRLTDLGATGILLSGNPAEGALIAKTKLVQTVPGRAQIVSRDRGHFVGHLAYTPPAHD
ncbi:MAG: type VII secretion protein EccCa [Micrococcales bacterium]|nr:type VII secretion protein EccCa [Micrococcales bacterium]